jgi:hypothetical protein
MTRARSIANIGAAVDTGLSWRNRLINGGFQINQRGAIAATSSGAYGPDRWVGLISGGTSISAAFNNLPFGGAVTGMGGWLTGSWTNGIPQFMQRIESVNSVDLNGQQITVSGKFYQDTGNSQNIVVRISKPNALNNFSSVTTVATSANITTLSGAVTPFTATFTLGGSDATNGLMVDVYLATAVTVTSKGFGIADMQLEAGSTANPFERRDIGRELMMCQRYYETGSNFQLFSGYVVASEVYYNPVRFTVTKRTAPGVTPTYIATLRFAAAAPAAQAISADGFWGSATATVTGTGYFQYTWVASSEL